MHNAYSHQTGQARQYELGELDKRAREHLHTPSFPELYRTSLSPSPSAAEGATPAEERHWQEAGAVLIQCVGVTTRMTQYAIAQASGLYHLFFLNRSVFRSDRLIVVMAALLLGGKIQEPQRLVKQIIEATWRLRYAHNPEEADLIHKQEVYSGVREAVGKAERALMYITGCKLEVALPYDAILELVQAAGLPALYKDLHVLAWNLCNDSWRTLVSLHHQPRHVAACCVIAACAIAGVAVPPTLWDLPAMQDLEPSTVQGMALEILQQYKRALQKASKQGRSADEGEIQGQVPRPASTIDLTQQARPG